MSRTRKEQWQWKKKERRRTGQRDPQKIRLHRERFLQRVAARSLVELGYRVAVFRSRLVFDHEAFETKVEFNQAIIGTLPYLAEDPTDSHFLLAQQVPEFNRQHEERYLQRHVSSIKRRALPCHLEESGEEIVRCASAVACQYRRWNEEKNLPECTR
jgi:hypothetical protein